MNKLNSKLFHNFRILLFSTYFISPSIGFSQELTPFKEPVSLISSNCKSIVVNMATGELSIIEGDSYFVICEIKKLGTTDLKCTWYNDKQKQFAVRDMVGGMMGAEGAIVSKDPGSQFILSGVTNVFESEDTVLVSDGRVRGKKVCAGNWLYNSEVQKAIKKSKK